jgi:hypothetical protein
MSNIIAGSAWTMVDGKRVFISVQVDVQELADRMGRKVVKTAHRRSSLQYGAIIVDAPDLERKIGGTPSL